jgi:hypothetical protein
MQPNMKNHHGPFLESHFQTRREFLNKFGTGFGALGLVGLLGPELVLNAGAQEASSNMLAPKQPHYNGTAKRVIHIFMNGAQSHIDTWDPKPELEKRSGQSMGGGGGMGGGQLLASPFKFNKNGKSGIEISEVFPKLGELVDDMAFIRSMYTDVPNHEDATLMMNCGDFRLPKPSMGSWVTYGLGTENQNLPGFVALNPGGYPIAGAKNWQSAFMPGAFQGTFIDPQNTKIDTLIENIKNKYTSANEQRQQLDLLHQLNEVHKQKRLAESQLEARIQSFELAYRMQTDATEAFDVSREPQSVMDAYGPGRQARQMIIARRLLERGVRFVQVWHGSWDTHDNIPNRVRQLAGEVDQPIAAFIKDLKARGMLKDTLVVCSSEFGRTPTRDQPTGRNHNAKAFTSWLAGGGVKGGTVYGATDELGAAAVENKVHVHDLHATMLHALGFDFQKLTYRSGGRDFRLTDVFEARIVKEILA